MFLRCDDKDRWKKLDEALSKKFGSNKIRFVSREDMRAILEKKLSNLKIDYENIKKDAASSAVKPREAGKKLRHVIKLEKAESDRRTIRERLDDSDGEKAEEKKNPFESKEKPTDTKKPFPKEEIAPEEVPVEEVPEEQMPAEEMSQGELPEEEAPLEQVPVTPEEEAAMQQEQEGLPQEQLPEEMPQEQALDEQGLPQEQMPEDQMAGEQIPEGEGVPHQEPESLRVPEPDPTLAQANDGAEQQKLIMVEQELNALNSALQEIQGLAQEQGLMTEEELENIIIPLQGEAAKLLQLLQSSRDYRKLPMQEPGPPNQVGDISRELTSPSTTFAQSSKTQDLSKARINRLRDGAGILAKRGRGYRRFKANHELNSMTPTSDTSQGSTIAPAEALGKYGYIKRRKNMTVNNIEKEPVKSILNYSLKR